MIGPRLRIAMRVLAWLYIATGAWGIIPAISQAFAFPDTPPGWERVFHIANMALFDFICGTAVLALLSIDQRLERKP